MNERFKFYAFIFLALRVPFDLVLSFIAYYQSGTLLTGIAFMSLCCVFYLFLYFGLKNEEFRGRYGRHVILDREPFSYWFVAALLVLFHLIITALLASFIHWQAFL